MVNLSLRKTFRLLAVTFFLSTVSLSSAGAQEVVLIPTEDGFKMVGDLYLQTSQAPSVLVMHQCNMNRTSMSGLAERLFEAGYTVLNIDQRGFGESISEDYQFTTPRTLEQVQTIFPKFSSDIISVFTYFKSLEAVDKTNISLVGASCGGSMSLIISAKFEIQNLVLIAPGGLDRWISDEHFEALSKERGPAVLTIIAEEDPVTTLDQAKKIFDFSASEKSQLMIYKGSTHGIPLFEEDASLFDRIFLWLTKNAN